jgi:hypothetical protein
MLTLADAGAVGIDEEAVDIVGDPAHLGVSLL